MKKCIVCGKQCQTLRKYADYIEIPRRGKNESFVLCKNDFANVAAMLADMKKDLPAYFEHKQWYERQAQLLIEAKKIFKRHTCKGKLSDAAIDAMNDEIYDLMCETCWTKYSAAEKRLKANNSK